MSATITYTPSVLDSQGQHEIDAPLTSRAAMNRVIDTAQAFIEHFMSALDEFGEKLDDSSGYRAWDIRHCYRCDEDPLMGELVLHLLVKTGDWRGFYHADDLSLDETEQALATKARKAAQRFLQHRVRAHETLAQACQAASPAHARRLQLLGAIREPGE